MQQFLVVLSCFSLLVFITTIDGQTTEFSSLSRIRRDMTSMFPMGTAGSVEETAMATVSGTKEPMKTSSSATPLKSSLRPNVDCLRSRIQCSKFLPCCNGPCDFHRRRCP